MWIGNFVVYTTPFVALIAWVLILHGFASPYPVELSPLLKVRPAVSNMSDLATADFGLFGSCTSPNAHSYPICTGIHGHNFSRDLLSEYSAKDIITPLRIELKILVGLGCSFAILSFIYWMIVFGLYLCGMDYAWGSFLLQWIPCVAFTFSFIPFLAVYMLFRKTCDDFNLYNTLRPGGIRTDDLVATMGNGFLAAWVGSGALFHCMTVLWVHFIEPKKAQAAAAAAAAPPTAAPPTASPPVASPPVASPPVASPPGFPP